MLQVQELPAGSLQEQKGGRLHKQKAPAQLSPLFPLEESGPNSFYNIITSHVKMWTIHKQKQDSSKERPTIQKWIHKKVYKTLQKDSSKNKRLTFYNSPKALCHLYGKV